MDFLEKMKMVMGNSGKFFESVKNEDMGPSIKYLLLLMIVPAIIMIVVSGIVFGFVMSIFSSIPGMESIPSWIQLLGPVIGLFAGVSFYVSTFVGSFISAAILHVIVYLMGVKKGFENTYKAVVYGSTPSILFTWLPFINIIFNFWSWYLVIKGLSKLQDMTMGKAFMATLVPLIAFAVIAGIMSLFFMASSASTSLFDPSVFVV